MVEQITLGPAPACSCDRAAAALHIHSACPYGPVGSRATKQQPKHNALKRGAPILLMEAGAGLSDFFGGVFSGSRTATAANQKERRCGPRCAGPDTG